MVKWFLEERKCVVCDARPENQWILENHPMANHKETLTVVVNGQPVEVKVNEHAPLQTVIPHALKESGNVGQPPENWELKDAAGNLLDLNKKIEDFHFADDVKLFLSLKAGVAGA